MDHRRPWPGAEGGEPSWRWPGSSDGDDTTAAASGSTRGRRVPAVKDEAWAATTGYAAGSAPTASDVKEEILADEALPSPGPSSSGASDASDASDASWLTDDERRRRRHPHSHPRPRPHPRRRPRQRPQQRPQDRPTREEEEQARFRRRFKPRMCRICLETVYPTFDDGGAAAGADGGAAWEDDGAEAVGLGAAVGAVREAAAGLGGRATEAVASAMPQFLRSSHVPRVRYVPENAEDGRLISPCRCKGSQKYVHEGCLQAWRHTQPLADRNFWKCPTCGFEYRIQRLRWGRLITHWATRTLLTLLVFALTLFVLGFVADPLIDLWQDPAGVVVGTLIDYGDLGHGHDGPLLGRLRSTAPVDSAPGSWWEHFLKGFFSLGIVGVIKTFLLVSPFTWFNLRGLGAGGRGRRRGGRGGGGRYDSMSWVFILVGVFTFLGATWKGISYMSGRLLERAGDHIVDIGSDEPDEDEDEPNDARGPGY